MKKNLKKTKQKTIPAKKENLGKARHYINILNHAHDKVVIVLAIHNVENQTTLQQAN